ncbi:MAG: hypothetical protein H0T42_16445 [Deltaproteobacteria bacterium]|nr:hypothetical protein [Deltaproteobacteria bacterium]
MLGQRRLGALALVTLVACGNDIRTEHDAPPGPKRVFITRAAQTGKFGGLAGADRICTTAGALLGGGPWKAWLSTSTVHAIDRITGTGPWVDTIGHVVFPSRAELMSLPSMPLYYDEAGKFLGVGELWTGTAVGGTYVATPSGPPCAEWTSRVGEATLGLAARKDAAWTAQRNEACDRPAHLICFEQ